MRSEHNGGASLAAFLLAVSTMMLLFVSPVEGQWTSCSTNADCPPTEPYCNVPDVPTAGRCGECLVTAFSYEPGSCPATDDQGNPLLCLSGQCESCESAIPEVAHCYAFEVDQKRNCLRDCYDYYACTTNADCPDTLPYCDIPNAGTTEGPCVATDPSQCVVGAFPGEPGSCAYLGFPADLCLRTLTTQPRTICRPCFEYEQDLGITTAAECVILEDPPASQAADVVANCQRDCFGFYACETNADCPDTLPFCNISPGATEGECASNCVVTAFPGEPGSCPALDDQGNPLLCLSDQCQTCESNLIVDPSDCFVQTFVTEDQQENCLRGCFGLYLCTSNSDCPAHRPTCDISSGATEGQCVLECEVSALPGAAESCPDIPVGELFAGPQSCVSFILPALPTSVSVCEECARFEQDLGITTAAECVILENPPFNQEADVVANCQRGCFGFYACETNADCPDTLPFCESGQCLAECGTNADCPADRPLCDAGQCLAECGTTADCPADRPLCDSGQCLAECGTNADCPADRPLCDAGQCLAECGTTADCPADRPLCDSGQCLAECGTTADCPADRPLYDSGQCLAECGTTADCPADRPLCDSGQCLAECGTNADCPSDRPICNAGQCEISVFSALDGMGGGSSA